MKNLLQKISLIAILLFVSLLYDSCKKDDDKSNNPIPITVTDIDGNVYHTVTIGTQVWMVENLKVSHYKNGTAIPNVTDDATWLSLTTGAYCDYNNTPNNSSTYGKLYNWHAVNTGNLCPTGWHVPTDAEWTTLINFLGGANLAGGKLKETGLAHWISPNTAATNETGFTALPGGLRYNFGTTYMGIGEKFVCWSSNEYVAVNAWARSIENVNNFVSRFSEEKTSGLSVRCIKD